MDGLFLAFTAVSGSSSSEESCTDNCLPGIPLNHFAREWSRFWICFFAVSPFVDLSVEDSIPFVCLLNGADS